MKSSGFKKLKPVYEGDTKEAKKDAEYDPVLGVARKINLNHSEKKILGRKKT